MSLFMNWNSNQLFDEIIGESYKPFTPKDKIEVTPQGNTIQMAIPGVPKNNISIDLKDKTLIVKYNGDSPGPFGIKPFSKAWNLPSSADIENITAHSDDGVLTINIPKRESNPDYNRKIVVN